MKQVRIKTALKSHIEEQAKLQKKVVHYKGLYEKWQNKYFNYKRDTQIDLDEIEDEYRTVISDHVKHIQELQKDIVNMNKAFAWSITLNLIIILLWQTPNIINFLQY